MPFSSLLAPHLPYLRRYARALAGNQRSGDAYVLAMLQTLDAAPEILDRNNDPSVETYRIFSGIWNSVAANRSADGAASFPEPERRLDVITPLPRQAFLLTTVEGFSVAQVAEILSIDEEQVSRLIEVAGREIAAQMPASILVIEDEPIIADCLEMLVEELGHRCVGNARTHKEAVDMARALSPDLILADVRLADGSSGLEAVNEIVSTVDVPAIFVTGYPEALLSGQRTEPAFLIAKPFRQDEVRAVVSQALFFGTKAAQGTVAAA